jgi:predicted ester cyclase
MIRVAFIGSLLALALIPTLPGSASLVANAQEATPAAECPVTSEDENVAIAIRWFDDALNGHDATMLSEIMAPNIAYHAATAADVDTVEETIQLVNATVTGFPDVHYTIDETITEDGFVVFVWHAEGTNTGEYQGRAPTGIRAEWTGINVFRLECGMIVEGWTELDALGRLRQIGALATPMP